MRVLMCVVVVYFLKAKKYYDPSTLYSFPYEVMEFSNEKWACKFDKVSGKKVIWMDKNEFRKALQLWEKEGENHALECSADPQTNSDGDNMPEEEIISEDNIITGPRQRKSVNYVHLNHVLFGPENIPGVDDGDDFVYGQSC